VTFCIGSVDIKFFLQKTKILQTTALYIHARGNRPALELCDARFARQFGSVQGGIDDAYRENMRGDANEERGQIGRKDGIDQFQDRSNTPLPKYRTEGGNFFGR